MINEIHSNAGYVFATADKSEVYDNIIVLGKYDTADNYVQITEAEANEIRAEKERQAELGAEIPNNI